MSKKIYVYADWHFIAGPTLVGELEVDLLRGKETYRFSYAQEWLQANYAVKVDPQLELFAGDQFSNNMQPFHAFADSSPDRWGRTLLEAYHSYQAKKQGLRPLALTNSDYFLRVSDIVRMGALRFKSDPNGPFIDDALDLATPPLARIRELEQAVVNFDRNVDNTDARDYESWLNLLVAPGAALGGARPKANLVDPEGNLWIAKFPSRYDDINVGLWEYLIHRLAIDANITMAESQVLKLSGKHHTFLTKRFDREQGKRIHFASAMTQLGYYDGESNASYLELAQFLTEHGCASQEDLEQLWRRIVFNIAVSNCDDHLRNHGFLLQPQGWRLAPAYDLNPSPSSQFLSLKISDVDARLDYNLAFETIDFYNLTPSRAEKIYDEVMQVVAQWRSLAKKIGIAHSEQTALASAFKV